MIQEPVFTAKSVADLSQGGTAFIKGFKGDEHFAQRMQEMGFIKGRQLKLLRRASFNGPLLIGLEGFKLAIRRDQAQLILVDFQGRSSAILDDDSPSSLHDEISRMDTVDLEPPPHGPVPILTNDVSENNGEREKKSIQHIGLFGHPNVGKTSIFNAMTGLSQKVGNYTGVTVERKEGLFKGDDGDIRIYDLPGTYSLSPQSPDEEIAVSVIEGTRGDHALDAILVVLDASQISRNLVFFASLYDLKCPKAVILTKSDMAQKQGYNIDVDLLSRCLGVPVAKVDGRRILDQGQVGLREIRKVCHALSCSSMDDSSLLELGLEYGERPSDHIEDRDRWAKRVVDLCVKMTDKVVKKTMGELNSIDQWLLHRWFGPLLLVLSMTFMFQMVYVVSAPFMDWTESFIQMLSSFTTGSMAAGALKSLLEDGIFGGVGGVLVFVPQIAILFFCISLMEESGYLARATFLLDRLLSSVGLHGKSFVPLLSSHACAIPGIMATRSMAHSRDRLATMLVAPYMSCGARLPVYALLIGAFMKGFGPWIQGLALMSCYLLGIGVAFLTSWIMKRSILKMKATDFVLEMPAYQCPRIKSVLWVVWEQVMAFVKKAGTIILGFSILLWGALTFPRLSSQDFNHFLNEQGVQREWYEANKALDGHSVEITDLDSRWSMIKLEHSFAGRMGKGLEDVIVPLGYDWKIGVGLIGAFAAREVFVSTLAIVYSMGNVDDDMDGLHEVMLNEVGINGQVLWSMPRVMSLLVFFVIAMQCISTMAVMKKETGSWKWPLFQWFMMNGLAYGMAWLIFNLGSALG